MQVFIIGTPLETAMALDKLRLNKQVIECRQILDAFDGKSAWSNHPCTLQYMEHKEWLKAYTLCLERYIKRGCDFMAEMWDMLAQGLTPDWHTEEYLSQMKRRLYTKNNEHYKQWAHLGESQQNWYFVDGAWRVYNNGKRLK